jgi:hypothetical protein
MIGGRIVRDEEVPPIVGLSQFVDMTDSTDQISAARGTTEPETGQASPGETRYGRNSRTLKFGIIIVVLTGLMGLAVATYILKSKKT